MLILSFGKGTSSFWDQSPEEFTRKDWLLGLVPRSVHTKLFEEQVAETCPKNSDCFELILGTSRRDKLWSLRLGVEAKMPSSQGLIVGTSPLVCADLESSLYANIK